MPYGFVSLGSTTLAAPASSITISNLPPRQNLMLVIYITGKASPAQTGIQFNTDTGNNYTWSSLGTGPTQSSGVGVAAIYLEVSAQTAATYVTVHMSNIGTLAPQVGWHGVVNGTYLVGGGTWATAAQVTSIKLTSAQNFNTGSYIEVFGAN